MAVPSAAEHWNEGQNHQGQRHKGEQDVRNQHCKIERTDHSLRSEMGRFFADVRVIDEVPDEKKCGCNHSRDHACHVTPPRAAPDQVPACRDENGADEIERCVDRWQIGNCHGNVEV